MTTTLAAPDVSRIVRTVRLISRWSVDYSVGWDRRIVAFDRNLAGRNSTRFDSLIRSAGYTPADLLSDGMMLWDSTCDDCPIGPDHRHCDDCPDKPDPVDYVDILKGTGGSEFAARICARLHVEDGTPVINWPDYPDTRCQGE